MEKRYLLVCLVLLITLGACERPASPDFKTEHKLSVPLTVEKSYPFLGNSDALLDTTKDTFSDLFSVDGDGLVRLSKQQDFNFGSLDDAIPVLSIDPQSISASVGPIELTDFGSGEIGSLSFNQLTGLSGYNSGQTVPAASSGPVTVGNLDPDYFQSAVIKENGKISIELTNSLGFNIDQNFKVTLLSDGTKVGSDNQSPFNHGSTSSFQINIASGTTLANIDIQIEADWTNQTMQADSGPLTVNSVNGQNLIAEQVTASIPTQTIEKSSTGTFNDSDFSFSDSTDSIVLSGGSLNLDVINNIDIAIEKFAFPSIKDANGNRLEVKEIIPRKNNGGTLNTSIDLSGYEIQASSSCLNCIDYTIYARTEDLQQGTGSDFRTISETDDVKADVSLSNLQIAQAEGIIKPRNILLNDDIDSDGALDLYNDDEAEVINIDGFDEISDQLSGLDLVDPVLSTFYETNIDIPVTIYASIAGINSDNETVFLSGDEGSDFFVQSSEIPSELQANGQALGNDQLVKFELDRSGQLGSVEFSKESGTNTPEFFNHLPTKIRFVGIAVVGDATNPGTITAPVTFSPGMGIEIPFNFAADQASFRDTIDADLGDLPGDDEEQRITGATLGVSYENGLPFELGLSLVMLDANGNEVTRYPENAREREVLTSAEVNEQSFVKTKHSDTFKISFTESQLKQLHKTRRMILDINFDTAQKQQVKVRADDEISLGMKMNVDITSSVN